MAKTNVERQRAWQKRRNKVVNEKRAELQAIVDGIMADVTFTEEPDRGDGKRRVTVEMTPNTRKAIDRIMEAQGTTFDAVMEKSIASWLAWEAKVRALKAKHGGGVTNAS